MNRNALLAWLSVARFAFATAWAQFGGSPIPFAGLREFSPPVLGWSLVMATAILALFLSLPRLHTRRRLLACSAYSGTLFVVVGFFASMVAPILLAFISIRLFRKNAQLR